MNIGMVAQHLNKASGYELFSEKKTKELLTNLTKTITNTALKQFEDAFDRAYMQNTGGIFNLNRVSHQAIIDFSKKETQSIQHPFGHIDHLNMAAHEASITSADFKAINDYKSAKSYIINEKLRNGSPISIAEAKFINSLEKALNKLFIYEGVVYRSLSEDHIKNIALFEWQHRENALISYKSFTSTSAEVYDESMKYQLVITSKTGRDMRAYNELEQEILFKREARFVVTKREGGTIFLEEV